MSKNRTDNSKRKLLKSAAIGGGVASITALPTRWTKPIVASVVLPAHAEASGSGSLGLGTIDNCPDEHSSESSWKHSSSWYSYYSTGTSSYSGTWSHSYGTCTDGSDLVGRGTWSRTQGGGVYSSVSDWNQYCGNNKIGHSSYTRSGTGEGNGYYEGTESGTYQWCELLVSGDKIEKAMKGGMAKRKAEKKKS